MSQWSSAAGGPGSGQAGEPTSGGPAGDEYPDDLWPDEDGAPGRPAGDGVPGWPQLPAGPGQPGRRPPAPRRRFAAVVMAAAAAAAAAGAGIVLAVDHAGAVPAASSSPAGSGGQAPGRSGGSGPAILSPGSGAAPGSGAGALPGGGSGSLTQIMMIGKVTAVSRTSITLGGPGRSITAAVTSATRVSGKVSSIGAIKVGDEVSAQLTRSGGRTVLVSVQDPAQAPPGGAP